LAQASGIEEGRRCRRLVGVSESTERLAHEIRVRLTLTELERLESEALRRLEHHGIRDGKSGVVREALRRFLKKRAKEMKHGTP
jgi:hypothetical protein